MWLTSSQDAHTAVFAAALLIEKATAVRAGFLVAHDYTSVRLRFLVVSVPLTCSAAR